MMAMLMLLCSCNVSVPNNSPSDSDIVYTGVAFTEQNGNVPVFSDAEKTTTTYEKYSELDELGRCGVAIAVLGIETMPAKDEERGSISNVTPSGWVQAKYDIVDGGYLYNRAHMIGWQLSAENDNKKNLITGTRYFNVEGMLPFENMVADYIRETAILVFPFFFGVSAYLIGLFLSFLVTAVCNLVYLHKKCPLIEKGEGQVCVHQMLLPLLLPLPLSLLGKLFHLLFSRFLHEFFALTLTGLLLALLTVFLYFLLGILPLPKRKKQSL